MRVCVSVQTDKYACTQGSKHIAHLKHVASGVHRNKPLYFTQKAAIHVVKDASSAREIPPQTNRKKNWEKKKKVNQQENNSISQM